MRKVLLAVVVAVLAIVVARYAMREQKTPVDGPAVTPPVATTPPDAPVETVKVPRAEDPAVAAAIDELLAAWDKVASVHAQVKTLIPEAAGHKGKTTGTGEYWLQKEDGKDLIMFDLRNQLQIEQPAGHYVTGEVLIYVIDGQHLYNFINQPGPHRKAVKKAINYDEVLSIGGPHLFRDLVTHNKLSLLPEEILDDRAVKVISAAPHDGDWSSTHYFDKATGLRVKMEEKDAQENVRVSITLSAIETNISISEDKFKFTVPQDTEFEDQTAMAP